MGSWAWAANLRRLSFARALALAGVRNIPSTLHGRGRYFNPWPPISNTDAWAHWGQIERLRHARVRYCIPATGRPAAASYHQVPEAITAPGMASMGRLCTLGRTTYPTPDLSVADRCHLDMADTLPRSFVGVGARIHNSAFEMRSASLLAVTGEWMPGGRFPIRLSS
jgi:hypothetical protein